MTTEEIYRKYIKAMQQATGDGTWVDWGVVRLGLRLAISDAYDAAPAIGSDLAAIIASQDQALQNALDQVDQLRQQIAELKRLPVSDQEDLDSARRELTTLIAERDVLRQRLAQIDAGRDPQIAHDYEKEIAGLNEQLAEMDADNSDLHNRLQQAQKEIDRLTRQNTIAVDAFNARNGNTNGNSANFTPAAQSDGWGRNHPAWEGMSDEQRVTVYRLTKGELRFRQISQEDRINLVGRVVRHLADADGKVTGPQFDRLRPTWMPTAGAVVLLSESRKWNDLLTMVAINASA